MLCRISFEEFEDAYGSEEKKEGLKLVNIRGTGGSGKSTIINNLLKYDSDAFEVFTKIDGMNTNLTICTVFPNFRILALGHYHTTCGGCDTFSKLSGVCSEDNENSDYDKLSDYYLELLKMLDKFNFNIFMEGLMISGIYGSYADIFRKFKDISSREIIIYSLLPPLSVCLERQKMRRGGIEVNPFHTVRKYRSVIKNTARFAKDFTSMAVDTSKGDIDYNFEDFFKRVKIELPENYKDKFLSNFNEDW